MSVSHFSIPSTKGRSTVYEASPVFFGQSRTRTFCLFSEDVTFRTPCVPHPPSRDDPAVGVAREGWVLSAGTE